MTILTRKVRLVWQNPYITDGLVAMWDGEWNAGGGIHDPRATCWKDIAGNHEMPVFRGTATWDAKSAVFDKNLIFGAHHADTANVPYCEVVFSYKACLNDADCVICFPVSGGPSFRYFCVKNETTVGKCDLFVSAQCNTIYSASFPVAAEAKRLTLNNVLKTRSVGGGWTPYGARVIFIGGVNQWNLLSGNIYSIRLYNRTLTAAEVTANYQIDHERFGC